jgi:hypothetical protein
LSIGLALSGDADFASRSQSHQSPCFGAWYEEDIYDNFCVRCRALMRLFHGRIPHAMRARHLIFVHVPRAPAPRSRARLYGARAASSLQHALLRSASIRPFAASAAPSPCCAIPSTVSPAPMPLCGPGGTALSRLSTVFLEQTADIASVDDYLSFLEERGPWTWIL